MKKQGSIALLTTLFYTSEIIGSLTDCYGWAEMAYKKNKPLSVDECKEAAKREIGIVFGKDSHAAQAGKENINAA